MSENSDRFGDVAAAMFDRKSVTLRVYEWVEVFRELGAGGSAYQKLQDAFNGEPDGAQMDGT